MENQDKNVLIAGKILDKLRELSVAEKRFLLEELTGLCEKQYRKGYQHGVTHVTLGQMDSKKANEFRLQGYKNNYRIVSTPIDIKNNSKELSKRMEIVQQETSDNFTAYLLYSIFSSDFLSK